MAASARSPARTPRRQRANSHRWAWRGATSLGSSRPSTPPPRRSARRPRLMATKTVRVDYIARVEGESSLELDVRDGTVEAVRLSIFEPPRFFEALLRGRG